MGILRRNRNLAPRSPLAIPGDGMGIATTIWQAREYSRIIGEPIPDAGLGLIGLMGSSIEAARRYRKMVSSGEIEPNLPWLQSEKSLTKTKEEEK